MKNLHAGREFFIDSQLWKYIGTAFFTECMVLSEFCRDI